MSPGGNDKELCRHVGPPINLNINDITAKQQHKAHTWGRYTLINSLRAE